MFWDRECADQVGFPQGGFCLTPSPPYSCLEFHHLLMGPFLALMLPASSGDCRGIWLILLLEPETNQTVPMNEKHLIEAFLSPKLRNYITIKAGLNLCFCGHMVSYLCVFVSKFPYAYKDAKHWIKTHPNSAWPPFNLNICIYKDLIYK